MVVCSIDDHPDNQGWFWGLDADYDNPNKAAYFQHDAMAESNKHTDSLPN
jgi:hypothetical protein